MRIGVIADIHCGPDRGTLPGSRSPALLERFVDEMRELRPACVVDLGDRITSVAVGQDRVRECFVRRRLEGVGVPVYHVLGNTDVERLTKDETLAAVAKRGAAEVVDLGVLRLILLDTVDPAIEGTGGAISAAQLEWLRVTLVETRVPCLIFGHHPLDEPVLEGHAYFTAHPALGAVRNRADVRAVLEGASTTLAVFAGHLHWTRAAPIGVIPYVTIGSLIETAYTGGEPSGTYALVTVGPEAVGVIVRGSATAQFAFPR